ncbi:MAG: hypothetical protein C5B57_10980 [Blastocatellia bacterium]|nr:MAG: hypothetical protein C5B57_10980 [Blastocatellia bacterium]
MTTITGRHATHYGDEDRDDDFEHQARECLFRPQDVRIISEYYAPHYRHLPPGLAKKYDRTGQLPSGWQRKIQPLPVERQLVVLPTEYRRGIIDGYAIVYNPRTQVVIDVVAALSTDRKFSRRSFWRFRCP